MPGKCSPTPHTGTIGQVKVMLGFWCFNKRFKGIKSRRGCDKVWNLKTACLPAFSADPGDPDEGTAAPGWPPSMEITVLHRHNTQAPLCSPSRPPPPPDTPSPRPSEPSASLWPPPTPLPPNNHVPLVDFPGIPALSVPLS